MIYEYAVSPKLFASEQHAAFLYQAFGRDAGRLLCEYPRRKWLQIALAIIRERTQDGELQKRLITAVTSLARLARSRQGELWDGNQTWIGNAIAEHGRVPFRSILWEGPGDPHQNARIPSITLCDEEEWRSVASVHVPRTAIEMIRPITNLLQLSRRVVLIDRNFNPADGRWGNVLVEMANVLRASPRQPRVDHINVVLSNMNNVTDQMFEQTARQAIGPRLPQGVTVAFKLKMSNRLHARFILTDVAGFQFADGLDELIGVGAAPTLITRLSSDSYGVEWNAWQTDVYRSFEITR